MWPLWLNTLHYYTVIQLFLSWGRLLCKLLLFSQSHWLLITHKFNKEFLEHLLQSCKVFVIAIFELVSIFWPLWAVYKLNSTVKYRYLIPERFTVRALKTVKHVTVVSKPTFLQKLPNVTTKLSVVKNDE